MASIPLPSALAISSSSSLAPSHSFISASKQLKWCHSRLGSKTSSNAVLTVRAMALDFSGSFFERGRDGEGDAGSVSTAVAVAGATEEKEEPQCPPGLRQYETMAVLRPDMTEDERLAFTQRYEELLVAGGGMYVEVFNRGVIPLAFSIRKKNKAGETNTYFDGIYLLFTYFTKPESMTALETRLTADDDVIRSSSFKVRKRKY